MNDFDEGVVFVFSECRCGQESGHEPDEDPPTCVLCGEPVCLACDSLVKPGLYGHRSCVEEEQTGQCRHRIIYLMAMMPPQALQELCVAAEYLSPQEADKELARQLVDRPVLKVAPVRRIASRWSSKRGVLP